MVQFDHFFFNDTATTQIYTLSDTLSLHDALPISGAAPRPRRRPAGRRRRVSCRRSEEHTSELQSPLNISYAVFCLKKKKKTIRTERLHLRMIHMDLLIVKTLHDFSFWEVAGVFFFLKIRPPPRSTR